jgi:predicted lipoprotein with Yx(FWY)xxD motif
MDRLRSTEEGSKGKVMSRHRAAVSIVSGALVLSAIGIGAVTGAATAVAPTSSVASAQPPARAASAATVHTAKATVGGRTETILVNSHGLPLYYYPPDTAKKSLVTGVLAQFWPPLVSTSPTETGAHGKLTVLIDANGHQVAYNGHFLYTFAEDRPGHVTGQGVQGFFLATPGLKPVGSSSAPKAMTTTPRDSYRPQIPAGSYNLRTLAPDQKPNPYAKWSPKNFPQ